VWQSQNCRLLWVDVLTQRLILCLCGELNEDFAAEEVLFY